MNNWNHTPNSPTCCHVVNRDCFTFTFKNLSLRYSKVTVRNRNSLFTQNKRNIPACPKWDTGWSSPILGSWVPVTMRYGWILVFFTNFMFSLESTALGWVDVDVVFLVYKNHYFIWQLCVMISCLLLYHINIVYLYDHTYTRYRNGGKQ